MKTFNYALVMMFLIILSCQKEDSTPLPEESLSGNQTVSFRSTPIADRDANLVSAFYEDLLDLQDRTGFYDIFYEQYGYFNWSGSLEYQSGGAGKILVVPVKTSALGMANGAFLYFDNGTNKRIKFVSRDAVEGKIAENRLGDLSSDEIFAYRNFLLTDLKHPESQQAMPAMNLSVFFDGFEEAAFGENDCEGGSYEYICFYNTSGSDELNHARLLRQFMNESYGNGDNLSNTYNGSTIAELHEHYNVILNSFSDIDQQAEFIRYFNDRVALYLETGIDDITSGILTGIVIDLERVCFNVWVWCWEDPFDFDFNSGSGGGSGGGGGNEDFRPTWQEEYDQLRFCEGVNDIFDTGPDNPSQLHPNYDFCAIWMAYFEDCIMPNQPEFNDFEAIGSHEELVLAWAEFQYNNPELFTTIIADPADCTPTSELEDYTLDEEDEVIIDEECRNALDDFLVAHGITMTKQERLAILTSGGRPDCGNQEVFEEWVCNFLGCNYCSSANTLFDNIKKDQSLINCSKVNCIYDLLADRMNQLFCQTIGNYMGSSIFDLEIRIGNILSDGVTNYREDEDLVVITLDENFCSENSSELAIMSTILHEGIHAEIMRLLLDRGLNPNEVNNYETVWDNYIVEYYAENSASVNDIQHAVMVRVEDYVSQIATALWRMNNQQLTVDHYKHYAWNGLRRYSIEFADDLYGMESPFFELYQELSGTNPSFDCN